MSRQKELAVNTIILTIGKICTQFISFLLLPLYTALLVPEEFGIVDLFNTYISLLVPIFSWQFENGLFRFLIDYRVDIKGQKTIISTVLASNFIQVIIYILFYICLQGFISSEFKLFLAIDVVLNIFLNTCLQLPRGLGHNTTYAVASFISAVSTVCLNIFFIVVLRYGALGMFVATVFAKIITISYLVFKEKIWSYFDISYCNISIFKEIFSYSIPLVPNHLAWWVIGVSDRSVISYVLGIAANGIYSVANKFSGVFITFYNIFNMSWTESVALHINDEDSNDFLAEVINSMFRLFSSVCIMIIAAMPIFFSVLVDEKYADAYQQIPILMIAVLFQVVVGLYSTIYVALKKSGEIAKTSFFAGIINISVNIILIGKIGLYAASVSTLVSFMVLAIYRYFHVKKYVDIKLDTKLILLTIIVGVIVICLYYYNQPITNWISFLGIIVYAIVINKSFLMSVLDIVSKKVKSLKK